VIANANALLLSASDCRLASFLLVALLGPQARSELSPKAWNSGDCPDRAARLTDADRQVRSPRRDAVAHLDTQAV
jgi:hypothetical protein